MVRTLDESNYCDKTNDSLCTFLDLVDELVVVVDENHKILSANKLALKILKYDLSELIEQPISLLFRAFKKHEIEKLFTEVISGNKTYCHIPFSNKTNELINVETKFKIGDRSGTRVIYLICKEISKLSLNKETFSTIFKTNPSLMCIMSMGSRELIEVNDTFLETLEFQRSDVIGKKLKEIDLHFDLDEYVKIRKMIFYDTSLKNIEIQAKTKSGQIKYGNLSTELIYIEDQPSLLMVLADITNYKLAQIELTKREQQFRDLTELLPEMICEVDTNGDLRYANKFALDKLGYQQDDLFNEKFNVFGIFSDEERSDAIQNFSSVIKSGEQKATEYRAKRKDGTTFPVIVYSNPIIENGETKGIRGVMVDISQRKVVEDQVKQSLIRQELLAQISLKFNAIDSFENKINQTLALIGNHTKVSRVYIFENNNNNHIASNTYEWLTNKDKDQFNAFQDLPYEYVPSWKTILLEQGIIRAENIKELPSDIYELLASQDVKSILVFPIIIKDNFVGFIGLDECCQIRNWDQLEVNNLKTITHIVSNAFERKKIEEELQESEHENRAIIDSIPDSIFRFNTKGQFISVKSSKSEEPFFSKTIHPGDHVDDIFSKELSTEILVGIMESISNGSFILDFNEQREEQTNYYVARFQKMNDHEVLAIVQNTTETKLREKQLQDAKNRAEDASQAKSEFLANVSHEIRTPMNAILGFSEVLIEKIEHPQYRNYLSTILSSGRTLLSLINDILDLSKIEAGKLEINMEPIQLSVLLNEMIQVFDQKAKQKNLALDFTVDQSIPSFIYMDEVRLHQVIFNMVGNAIKYTEKGYVQIKAWASGTPITDEVDLFVSIEDTGIGIPEEQQKAIFEAFTQQSGQSNRKFEGTGLGLSIAQKLATKLGGEIQLESKAGYGSKFTVALKRIKVAQISAINNAKSKDNIQNIEFEPATIMIVDDIDYNIMILKTMIEFDSITFIEADSGEMALNILQTAKPDLIFMDIRMHGISGFSATEIIKKNPSIKHIPVVAFTASVMESEIEQIKVLFDGFLRKPVSRKKVFDTMRKFLKHRILESKTNAENAEDKDQQIDGNEMLQIAEMVKQMRIELIPEWTKVKDDLIVFEIQTFADQMANIIADSPCQIIRNYHEELNDSINSFDVDKIENSIREFPEVLSKIEELCSKNLENND